jgi:hypothetical protein
MGLFGFSARAAAGGAADSAGLPSAGLNYQKNRFADGFFSAVVDKEGFVSIVIFQV